MDVVEQRSGFRWRTPTITRPAWTRALLICGIASALLYLGVDVLAAFLYDGYSYTGQTISELSAVDAETRSLWIPLGFVYSILVIAYGAGIWTSSGGNHRLRVVAGLVLVVGVLGLVAWPLAPMHQREVLEAGGGTLSDTMHLVLGAVDSLLFLLIVGFGAGALGNRFRIYSIATIVIVLVFGALTGLDAPNVADDEPTPWIGVTERVAVYGPMLWMAVLAMALLRVQSRATGGES